MSRPYRMLTLVSSRAEKKAHREHLLTVGFIQSSMNVHSARELARTLRRWACSCLKTDHVSTCFRAPKPSYHQVAPCSQNRLRHRESFFAVRCVRSERTFLRPSGLDSDRASVIPWTHLSALETDDRKKASSTMKEASHEHQKRFHRALCPCKKHHKNAVGYAKTCIRQRFDLE